MTTLDTLRRWYVPVEITTLTGWLWSAVGVAVLAENENILHALEHAIAAMVATGKYERLRKEHGLPAELSPFGRRSNEWKSIGNQ